MPREILPIVEKFGIDVYGAVHVMDLRRFKREHEGALLKAVCRGQEGLAALREQAGLMWEAFVLSVTGYTVGGVDLMTAYPDDWRSHVPLDDRFIAGTAIVLAALRGTPPVDPQRSGRRPLLTGQERTPVQGQANASSPPSPPLEDVPSASTGPATAPDSDGSGSPE